MAVSFATAANGIAAPTSPSGAGEPIGVDSLYLADFAEDLTIAIDRATATDSAVATGLAVLDEQGGDPSMQIVASEGGLQVLPPQVLNQAINRAILASVGGPATILVSANDSAAPLAAMTSEGSPATLIQPVDEVLSQWESRFFNVARSDTQSRPIAPDVGKPADISAAKTPHLVGEMPSEQVIVGTALNLAQSESDQPSSQTPSNETQIAINLPRAELGLNGRQQMTDVATSVAPPRAPSATREHEGSAFIQHSMIPGTSDGWVDETAMPARPELVGVEPTLGVSSNHEQPSVLSDTSVERTAQQLSVEQPKIQDNVTSLASAPDRGPRLSADELQRSAESNVASRDELLKVTVVDSDDIPKAGSAVEDESLDTLAVEAAATPGSISSLSAVATALAGQSNFVASNVSDRLRSSSDAAESIPEIVQVVTPKALSADADLIVAGVPKDIAKVAAAGSPADEMTPSTALHSSVALSEANIVDTSRAASMLEPARAMEPARSATWLDAILRDDVSVGSGTEFRTGKIATVSNQLSGMQAAEIKLAPKTPSDLVVSESLSNSALFISALNDTKVDTLATSDISAEQHAKDESRAQGGLGVALPDRLASAMIGSAIRQSDYQGLSASDDVRAVIEVQSTDAEQAAAGRVTAESTVAMNLSTPVSSLSSTGLLSDRFSVTVSQSSVATAESQSNSPLMNNVSIEVKQLLTSGGGSVRMALTPPEQGTLQLDLVVSDSGNATLEVYGVTDAIRERLESGSTMLQRQFEQMGLTLSLSLFDHGKGFDFQGTRDPQMMAERTSEAAADVAPRVTKRSGMSVGDDTGRVINLIA